MIINKERLVKEFLSLVKIDNPSKKEGAMSRHLKKELRKLGLKVKVDLAGEKISGETGNIIATLKGEGKTLLLNAHLDSVSDGAKVKPQLKRGVIRSDGTTILGADDKAGLAVILEVLRVIKEKKIKTFNLKVVLTVAEEIGLLGAKELNKNDIKADFGLALDGGDVTTIINTAPSQSLFEIEVIGRAAHAGIHPEDGLHAIKIASLAISKLKLGKIDHETTLNIGIIHGGKATNIIPERVLLKGEVRSHKEAKLKRELQKIKKTFQRVCQEEGVRLKFKSKKIFQSFKVSSSAKIIKILKKIEPQMTIKSSCGGSDANIFNEKGVPTIIFGTGMHRVHSKKEYLKVSALAFSANLLLKFLNNHARLSN